MSREIKFRAWDIINKRILEYKDIMTFPMYEVLPGTPEQRAYEVMQYTGLKDKNDKEIYEGDIVKFNNSFGALTGMIRYYANCKPIIKSNNKRSVDIAECNEEDLEVIGNIYENAELLEGEE